MVNGRQVLTIILLATAATAACGLTYARYQDALQIERNEYSDWWVRALRLLRPVAAIAQANSRLDGTVKATSGLALEPERYCAMLSEIEKLCPRSIVITRLDFTMDNPVKHKAFESPVRRRV